MRKNLHKRGQALVEFALLIPLFIFLFLGFIDLARWTTSYLQLSNSVREATRYAMVNEFNAVDIQNVVYQYAPTLDSSLIDFLVPAGYSDVSPLNVGDQVIIRATYHYQPITPGLNLIMGDTPTVQSSVTLAPYYQ